MDDQTDDPVMQDIAKAADAVMATLKGKTQPATAILALQCVIAELIILNATSPAAADSLASDAAHFVVEQVAEGTRRRMN